MTPSTAQHPIAGINVDGQAQSVLVERPRLLQRLAGAPEHVLLVDGAAGYGKSSLLAQWAARDPRPFVSLAIGEVHNDPIALMADLTAALGRVEPVPDDLVVLMHAPSPNLALILARLDAVVRARRTPMVLVLDELEHLRSDESLRLVAAVGQSVPDGSQIAIATRAGTPPHLARLRAGRRLTEIGGRELAMTRLEARELSARIGVELSDESLDQLVAKTEGWPAALYVAALFLRDTPDPDDAVVQFSGDHRFFVEYISSELLQQLPPDDVRFLTRISILDQLDGDLCDAVLDRTRSAKMLWDLSCRNTLVHSLDAEQQAFRLHPLLREMLRSELERSEPELIPTLHERASAWHAEHGDRHGAVTHALAAGDIATAAKQIWIAVPEYNASGRLATVQGWMEHIGLEHIVADPHLTLTVAQGHLAAGEGNLAEHWTDITRRLIDRGGTDLEPTLLAGLALADALLARDGIEGMAERASHARTALSDESPWLSMCSMLQGVAAHLGGHPDTAKTWLADGARRAAVWEIPVVQVACLAQLALLEIDRDDWQAADILASQARAQVRRSGLGDYRTMALVMAVSAYSNAHRGRRDDALADMREAMRLAHSAEGFGSWCQAEVYASLADASSLLGDVAGARVQMQAARAETERTPGAPVLEAWLARIDLQLDALSAPVNGDLTPAEFRLLQRLPTHLSFPQLAQETHVSTNTMKSHARSIYRKLGVASRQDAVLQARAAGLLPAERGS